MRAAMGEGRAGEAAWAEPRFRQTHWLRGEGSLGQPPLGVRGTQLLGQADRCPVPSA